MKAIDILPRLNEQKLALMCRERAQSDSDKLYRVPVEHRSLGEPVPECQYLLDRLPDLESFDQLRAILGEHDGFGLFAPQLMQIDDYKKGSPELEKSYGAVLVLPPNEWGVRGGRFVNEVYDDIERTFADFYYNFDELVVFAAINYKPAVLDHCSDLWFLVKRGPMKGKVFYWSHDGESSMRLPWADDVATWGERLWAEVPEIFGGSIRYSAIASIDQVPDGAELYPERLVSE